MKNAYGFTLLEVVVAITISSILLVGLSSMGISIRQINARSRDTSEVNALVVSKAEELRSKTFLALIDGTYDFTDELPQTITKARTAEYNVIPVSGNDSLKEVEFIVRYNSFNKIQEYKYKTYIGELGAGQY